MKRGTSRRCLVGVVWLVLAACRADVEPGGAPLLTKVSPASLSVSDAWGLFDRSVSSTFTPTNEPIRATLDHERQLWAVKVYGAAPYHLAITGANGLSLGFDEIDLSRAGPGWHTFSSDALVGTKEVELRFQALGDASPVPEIELWAVDDARPASRSSTVLTGQELPPGYVAVPAETTTAALQPSECASIPLVLTRSPAELRRAYLVFRATGLFRPFSLRRSINGADEQGGVWLAADASPHTFQDEIDPATLQLGTNQIHWCSPGEATSEVALSDVRLVAQLDRGFDDTSSVTIGDDAPDGGALLDGESSTELDIGAGERVAIAFDRLISPDTIVLTGERLPDAATIECIGRDGHAIGIVARAQRGTDDLAFELQGGGLACAALAIVTSEPARLAKIRVAGSGAAEPDDWARLVVTSPFEHFGDRAWVSGFVARPRTLRGAVRVAVDGLTVAEKTGTFGTLVHRTNDLDGTWQLRVAARLPDGTTQTRDIVFSDDRQPQLAAAASSTSGSAGQTSSSLPFGREGEVAIGRAVAGAPVSIQLGTKIGAHIPAGAVSRPTAITIRQLGEDEVPPLDPGMVNVTAPDRHAYEFLPHGQRFAKPIDVVVPYDPQLLPDEMKPEDVNTYFYDPVARHWQKLDRTAIDVAEHDIHSATSHFTIMIDAVLALPKNPSPRSLDPTALSSSPAASPAANIDLIEPPEATSTGDARTALPIRAPSGRGAYTPSLAISYDSSAGNGWLGVGWEVHISRVEIDTRWGVPSYAPGEEPRYLLDGAELVPTTETEGPGCTVGTGRRYHTRIEGAFAYIVRCQRDGRFHFEVRDRDGTLYVYGPDGPGNVGNSALADPQDPTPDDPQHMSCAPSA